MCIFALQLQEILKKRDKHIGSLYSVIIPAQPPQRPDKKEVSPLKVKRLKNAIKGNNNYSTTLSPIELEAVQKKFSFTDREIIQMRAALAGEFVFSYLLDRVEPLEKALVAGDAVFHLLFDEKDENMRARSQSIIDIVRNRDEQPEAETQSTLEKKMSADLEPIIELYDEALLCLEAAQMARNPLIQQGYTTMALSLLTNAKQHADYPSELIQGTSELAEWQELIALALAEAQNT